MRTLESGQYQPETGRREMGLQAKFSFGQPGQSCRLGANQGGQMEVQRKRNMVQRAAQPLTGDSLTYGESMRELSSKKENKTGLPDRLKAGIENLSGYSMDDVRVHYNSEKPAQLQALAYAQGTDIHVGPGQEKHLAHEAWHVVQQKQGRVRSTRIEKGVLINDQPTLEREAINVCESCNRGAAVQGKLEFSELKGAQEREKKGNFRDPGSRITQLAKYNVINNVPEQNLATRSGLGDAEKMEIANLRAKRQSEGKSPTIRQVFKKGTLAYWHQIKGIDNREYNFLVEWQLALHLDAAGPKHLEYETPHLQAVNKLDGEIVGGTETDNTKAYVTLSYEHFTEKNRETGDYGAPVLVLKEMVWAFHTRGHNAVEPPIQMVLQALKDGKMKEELARRTRDFLYPWSLGLAREWVDKNGPNALLKHDFEPEDLF
ncbi:MAG: DUF4157 domain-containing protein [Moorea sp. SIO4E2]|nr:DUF4157 domain-containing protein [Moorena sp. SIO4E2]